MGDFIKHIENALKQRFGLDEKDTRRKILKAFDVELENKDDGLSGE